MGKRKVETSDGVVFNEDTFSLEELDELDEQFDPCEHGRKLRCDACLSREWDKGKKEGFELGFFWVINEIKNRAGKAYADGKDTNASILRDLANSVIEVAEKVKVIPDSSARKR